MASKYNWTGMYRPNMFTPDNERDQLVDVQILGSVRDDDIANDIIEEGIELKKETLCDVIKRYEKTVAKRVLSGYAYSNDFVQMQPRITGVFESTSAQFDPAIHKCTVDMCAGTVLRSELSNVSVKILGEKDAGGAKISSVTDVETGDKDTLTAGEMVLIEGDKIKIQDEKDESQGVFFIDEKGVSHRVDKRLALNKPSQIMVKVPSDVAEGAVSLVIKTKYTTGGAVLKAPRELKYNYKLTAKK